MTESGEPLSDRPRTSQIELEHWVAPENEVSIKTVSELIYPLFSLEPEIEGECQMRLAGCTIEEQPLVRLDFHPPRAIDPKLVKQIFVSEFGELDAELAQALRLDDATRCDQLPEWLKSPSRRANLQQMVTQIQESHEAFWPEPEDSTQPVSLRIVWAKYVSGKLQIESGDDSKIIKFAGWANRFTNGSEVCPPFLCDVSGKSSYRITADDDQQLTVPAAIGICEISERRLLESKLQRCNVSGKRVDKRLLWTCPSSGKQLIGELAVSCNCCDQSAAPTSLVKGLCRVCQSRRRVTSDDGNVQMIRNQYVQLNRVSRWTAASCQVYTVIVCRYRWKPHVFVVNNETGEIETIRRGDWLGKSWQTIEPGQLS